MNVSLTPALERLVRDRVESGFYNNASEVVREALRLMETHERLIHQEKREQLRAYLQEGVASIERGEGDVIDGPKALSGYFARFADGE